MKMYMQKTVEVLRIFQVNMREQLGFTGQL